MKIFYNISPGFYKNLLCSAVNKRVPVLVVYTTEYDASSRNKDFMQGERDFPHIQLTGSKWVQIWDTIKILRREKYSEIITGGYESVYDWTVAFLSPRKKNAVMVESTIRETKKTGIRAFLKKIFFKRMSKAYVCGTPHAELVKYFGFNGEIVNMQGVGLFNTIVQPAVTQRVSGGVQVPVCWSLDTGQEPCLAY